MGKDGDAVTTIATDGACGLSWDDSIITSMTPAPSARCPFERFHKYREGWTDVNFGSFAGEVIPLALEDIPEDWPVQPTTAGDAV